MSDITAEIVRRYLRYDGETGKLYWQPRKPEDFPNTTQGPERACKVWNTRYASKEAFKRKGKKNGYLYGAILDRVYLAHRIIWLLVFGRWPVELDHINGVRDDNRIVNLRHVDRPENSKNKAINSNNTSGTMGVYLDKRRGTWFAMIGVNYKNIRIGSYANKNDAIAARLEAEDKYRFHENHGRAAA